MGLPGLPGSAEMKTQALGSCPLHQMLGDRAIGYTQQNILLAGPRNSSQKRCVLDVFWTYLSVVSWVSNSGVPISRPRTRMGIKPVLWVHHGATCPAGHHG